MRKLLLVLPLAVMLVCGCGDGGPGSGTVTGSVVDTSYTAISGATMTLDSSSTTTKSNGVYTFTSAQFGLRTLTASSANYISVTKQITVSGLSMTSVPLIVLAQKDGKSTQIGPGGGDATSTDGAVKVSIPANALASTYSITVTHSDVTAAPTGAPAGYKLVYLIYISPQDISLSSNATLTIPLPPAATGESTVPFYRFDPATLSWVSIGSGSVSSALNIITAGINKFGWIAAAVPITPTGSITGKVVDQNGAAIIGASVWGSPQVVVTDFSGRYSLANLMHGATTVQAYMPDYNINSISVTAVAGTTVTAPDIMLTRSSGSFGTITGFVKNASDNSPVQGARVVAGGVESVSNANGAYELLNIEPGNLTVYVYAYGYLAASVPVSVTAAKTISQNFSLTSVSVNSFSDGFETDLGWTYGGIWNRSLYSSSVKDTLAPVYVTLPDDGSVPAPHSGNYAAWFGSSSTGSYIGTQDPADVALSGGKSVSRMQGSLTSPVISLNGFAYATLSFWTWWEIEGMNPATGYDNMKVQITKDGGATWTDLALLNPSSDPELGYGEFHFDIPYSSGGYDNPGAWTMQQIDLTPYVGNAVSVRFNFDSFDGKYNGFRGWFIDDVSVGPDKISVSGLTPRVLHTTTR